MTEAKHREFTIAASILSADFSRLGEDVQEVLDAGADWVHFDVMDNHYVPNLTVGPLVCESLRRYGIKAPIDVHLMVKPVDRIIADFAEAGASIITIHPEATEHLDRSIKLIRDCGCKVGLAFNPATPLTYLNHLLNQIDMVLIMSVNPGFSRQPFIAEAVEKIRDVRQLLDRAKLPVRVQVDGGIKPDNIRAVADAGADVFVAGSAIFHADDYGIIIKQFRDELS